MTTGKLVCPGSGNTEHSYQPRLIVLPIVPNNLWDPQRPPSHRLFVYLPKRLDAVSWVGRPENPRDVLSKNRYAPRGALFAATPHGVVN